MIRPSSRTARSTKSVGMSAPGAPAAGRASRPAFTISLSTGRVRVRPCGRSRASAMAAVTLIWLFDAGRTQAPDAHSAIVEWRAARSSQRSMERRHLPCCEDGDRRRQDQSDGGASEQPGPLHFGADLFFLRAVAAMKAVWTRRSPGARLLRPCAMTVFLLLGWEWRPRPTDISWLGSASGWDPSDDSSLKEIQDESAAVLRP